jgi:L-amino acid N-acyltransferase YncA
MTIREMTELDWPEVADIFRQGIDTGTATFQSEVPTYAQWDATHIPTCRLVAVDEHLYIVGWAALTPVSSRCAYRGVAEVSIYIAAAHRGRKVGKQLLSALVQQSEEAGYWTLQSVILVDNNASISLHESCGFRLIGRRERISVRADGTWSDTLLMERRSDVVGI